MGHDRVPPTGARTSAPSRGPGEASALGTQQRAPGTQQRAPSNQQRAPSSRHPAVGTQQQAPSPGSPSSEAETVLKNTGKHQPFQDTGERKHVSWEAPRERKGPAWGAMHHQRQSHQWKGTERTPSRENTCLNEVFSLKNVSNFIHDDIIFSPPESIKMNMLNDHLNMTRGHRLLSMTRG